MTGKKGETPSMPLLIADSRLNRAERALQHSFMKSPVFNGLLMAVFVLLAYWPLHRLPDRMALPAKELPLRYRPVSLPAAQAPLRFAGAWEVDASDPRFGGLSALAMDRGRFLAVSDLGAAVWFDPPFRHDPGAQLRDLGDGPGPFGKKWSRDAESLARDPRGRGWWVGYEQRHSLWLYDDSFLTSLANINLQGVNWRDNRGAEGLIVHNGQLLVLAENGRDAVLIEVSGPRSLKLHSNADVAEAARAPDGSAWLLLREKSLGGITQWIAPLLETRDGYIAGPGWPVPKAAFDNYEGMAIEPRPDGGWRFWLVTDDGHRIMARTLLVALDLDLPVRNGKGPARRTEPSKKPQSTGP
jgi:hypothetical protein